MFKKWVGGAKKGNGPFASVIVAANNVVIASTSTIPEKIKAAEDENAMLFSNSPAAKTPESPTSFSADTTPQVDLVTPTAVEEQVSKKPIIKPVMLDYIKNHITERKDFPRELIGQNMSEIELVKQLVRLRKDELNDLLAKAIIDTKDLYFITQVINLQDLDHDRGFNLKLINLSKQAAEGYNLVFNYAMTHNKYYDAIAPILDEYDNATTKNDVKLLSDALDVLGDNNSELIGAIFPDQPTE